MIGKRQNILGVQISLLNLERAVANIHKWIMEKDRQYVCVTPAHGVMDCYNDPSLREIFNQSGMTTPDGMSIVWLLKLYGHKNISRVYGPDLLIATCEAGLDQNWRHFFYGGDPGVSYQLSEKLLSQFPNLQIVGNYSPPFRSLNKVERQEVIDRITDANPDIVWVGLSTPKQEKWMKEFISLVDVSVMIGVGAAFDFLSGTKRQAPKWVQRTGLEWLFRFLSEPSRLWPRYRQYPKFLFLSLFQWIGILKFDDEEYMHD